MKTALKVVGMGRTRIFVGTKHFGYGVNTTTCTVEDVNANICQQGAHTSMLRL